MRRYHASVPIPGEPSGSEMCRKPHPKISRIHLEGIIRACSDDLRLRLLDASRHINMMLDRYYGISRIWSYEDLHSTLDEEGFDNQIIFYDVPIDDLDLIHMDTRSLNLIKSFETDVWSIPFIDHHALSGYQRQIHRLREVRNILHHEWHLCTSYDFYLASFSTLVGVKRYIAQRYPDERGMLIYRNSMLVESYP